MGTKP